MSYLPIEIQLFLVFLFMAVIGFAVWFLMTAFAVWLRTDLRYFIYIGTDEDKYDQSFFGILFAPRDHG